MAFLRCDSGRSAPFGMRAQTGSAALIAAAVIGLAGCAGSPASSEEQSGAAEWGAGILDASDGGVGGVMGQDADGGVRMDFPSPEAFGAVELRCKGTDRAQFTLRYTGTGSSLETTQDIVCHDGGLLTPIAIPTDVGDLTAFEATATSPDGVGYWVAIPQR